MRMRLFPDPNAADVKLIASLKGTVMQTEEVLIHDRLRVSKVSRKFRIPIIYNFAVIYP